MVLMSFKKKMITYESETVIVIDYVFVCFVLIS